MTHPITPPPELVKQWRNLPEYVSQLRTMSMLTITTEKLQDIATQAARWGADMELEACCEWFVRDWTDIETADKLRATRRPKPLSLNDVALQMLSTIERDAHYLPEITDTIRRALEQLDD
jgi:hypothetical protein